MKDRMQMNTSDSQLHTLLCLCISYPRSHLVGSSCPQQVTGREIHTAKRLFRLPVVDTRLECRRRFITAILPHVPGPQVCFGVKEITFRDTIGQLGNTLMFELWWESSVTVRKMLTGCDTKVLQKAQRRQTRETQGPQVNTQSGKCVIIQKAASFMAQNDNIGFLFNWLKDSFLGKWKVRNLMDDNLNQRTGEEESYLTQLSDFLSNGFLI